MDEKQSQVINYPQSDDNPPRARTGFSTGGATNTGQEQQAVRLRQNKLQPETAAGAPPMSPGRLAGIAHQICTGKANEIKGWPILQRPWLRKHGALLASVLLLLIVLGTLGAVLYNHFVVLSVTAFQVGQRQNVPQFIGGGGMVYSRQQFDLTSPFPARINAVLVNVGDHVKANQPLLKLDQTSLNAQLKMAQDNVGAAEAYLNSVSGAIPYNPVTVAAAQQDLSEARAKYEAMQAQATSGNVTSPITGIVTMLKASPGESFGANVALLTVVDTSVLIVHAKIPLSNLSHVRVGMNAVVTPPAMASVKLQGKVISIVPQADPQTDTFEVWVQTTNNEQTLLPGMSAFVSIQGQVSAFVLPRLAVLNPDHESSVFLIRDGHAQIKEVHVVGRNGSSVFVDDGLSAGDMLVLLTLDKVHDGQGLKINKVQR